MAENLRPNENDTKKININTGNQTEDLTPIEQMPETNRFDAVCTRLRSFAHEYRQDDRSIYAVILAAKAQLWEINLVLHGNEDGINESDLSDSLKEAIQGFEQKPNGPMLRLNRELASILRQAYRILHPIDSDEMDDVTDQS